MSDPRPDHVRAISWLNEAAPADFYLLKIEGIRIGDSLPAPLLTRIVGPSEESRGAVEAKKDRAERYNIRRRFFTGLLERAKPRTRLHAAISPSESSWVGAGAGKSGLSFNYTIIAARHRRRAVHRHGSAEGNQAIFDALRSRADEIEAAYRGELSWEPLEGKRGCRIAERLKIGGYRHEETWEQLQDAMIDNRMIRLEHALRPFISKLSSCSLVWP